jgi:hypothetical protein
MNKSETILKMLEVTKKQYLGQCDNVTKMKNTGII